MKKFRIIVVVITVVLLIGVVTAAAAKEPHKKATGTVTWTARTHLPEDQQLPGLVSSFDAHDNEPGKEADRGTYQIYRPADSSGFPGGDLTLDISCVNVDGNEAWFAGTVTSASGGYTGNFGDVYLYWVKDDATPGSMGDKIGGISYGSLVQACAVVDSGGWIGTGVVTGGNLKVHTY